MVQMDGEVVGDVAADVVVLLNATRPPDGVSAKVTWLQRRQVQKLL